MNVHEMLSFLGLIPGTKITNDTELACAKFEYANTSIVMHYGPDPSLDISAISDNITIPTYGMVAALHNAAKITDHWYATINNLRTLS